MLTFVCLNFKCKINEFFGIFSVNLMYNVCDGTLISEDLQGWTVRLVPHDLIASPVNWL